MTWWGQVLIVAFIIGISSGPLLLLLFWGVRDGLRSPSRGRKARKPEPDPVAEHYTARRRERAAAAADWERDFRHLGNLPRHDVPHMPAEYLTQEHVGQKICSPHSGPALPHSTWRVPAGTITAVHEADVIEDHALCDEPHTIVTGVNLEIDGRAIHLPPRQPVRLTLPR